MTKDLPTIALFLLVCGCYPAKSDKEPMVIGDSVPDAPEEAPVEPAFELERRQIAELDERVSSGDLDGATVLVDYFSRQSRLTNQDKIVYLKSLALLAANGWCAQAAKLKDEFNVVEYSNFIDEVQLNSVLSLCSGFMGVIDPTTGERQNLNDLL